MSDNQVELSKVGKQLIETVAPALRVFDSEELEAGMNIIIRKANEISPKLAYALSYSDAKFKEAFSFLSKINDANVVHCDADKTLDIPAVRCEAVKNVVAKRSK